MTEQTLDQEVAEMELSLRPDCEDGSKSLEPTLSVQKPDTKPLGLAEFFLKESAPLRYYRGSFYEYTGCRWEPCDEAGVRAQVYGLLRKVQVVDGDSSTPLTPNRAMVTNVLDAIQGIRYVDSRADLPVCLDTGEPLDPSRQLVCQNGILDLDTLKLSPLTPNLFNVYCVAAEWNPKAPEATEWIKFLRSIFKDQDQEESVWFKQVELIRQMIGYLLTPDTKRQKMFMLLGPPRSGKGTIGRILKELLPGQVVNPTVAQLSKDFGLAQLVDRSVAIVGDARPSGSMNMEMVAERLLGISGEDSQSVDRKYKTAWNGTLRTRFLIISNSIPRLYDSSAALAGRFVFLETMNTFFGMEDLDLFDKLRRELPGILKWSVQGWKDLQEREQFIETHVQKQQMELLRRTISPLMAWWEDEMILDNDAEITNTALYENYTAWCGLWGNVALAKNMLIKELVGIWQRRIKEVRRADGTDTRGYRGMRIKTAQERASEDGDGADSW